MLEVVARDLGGVTVMSVATVLSEFNVGHESIECSEDIEDASDGCLLCKLNRGSLRSIWGRLSSLILKGIVGTGL